jgi:4-amino-4-deoxy-L-arabinose transferase-like glycosyltransferase
MPLAMATRERRDELPAAVVTVLGLAIAGAAALAWTRAGWLALAPDDATYLNVGRHLLAGEGPVRLGEPYLIRSPLFGGLLALPGRLGFDLISGAHWLNLAFTIGACLAAGGLAWRLWGAPAGLLALALAVAQPLAAQVAPTLRIDALPAMLVLVALTVAVQPVRRSSQAFWQALLVGVVLGFAFLVKETTVAFAGAVALIPFAMGQRAPAVLRGAAVAAAGALLTSAWWLAWHGVLSGRLPYLPLPAIAIVPLAAGAAAALVLAWRWHPYSAWPSDDAGAQSTGPPTGRGPAGMQTPVYRRLRWPIAVVGAIGWSVAAAISAIGQRPPIIDLGQTVERFIGVVPGWPVMIVTLLLGLTLAPRLPGLMAPTMAAAAFLPIGLLVISYDFGARNFLVWALLASVAGAGLLWAAAARLLRERPVSGVPMRRAVSIVLLVLALATSGAGLTGAAFFPASDVPRAQVESDLRRLAQRIRAVAPRGSTIVVSSAFGAIASQFELLVADRYEVRRISPSMVSADPASPTGLAHDGPGDRAPVMGVLALTYHPRSDGLLALEARPLQAAFVAEGPSFFLYITDSPVSPNWLVERLVEPNGFVELARRPVGTRRTAFFYRVDQANMRLGGLPMLTEARALGVLLDTLETRLEPPQEAAALRALLPYGVEVRPRSAAGRAALDRLRGAMDVGSPPSP